MYQDVRTNLPILYMWDALLDDHHHSYDGALNAWECLKNIHFLNILVVQFIVYA